MAAVFVCIFHMTAVQHLLVARNPVKYVSGFGYLGVQIFFVISGFVIPWSLYHSSYKVKNFFGYLLKRILRIEPPYLVSILLVLCLNFLSSKSHLYTGLPYHISIEQFLAHLIYLPKLFGFAWYQPVYYTLLIEFEFYILIGLMFPLLIVKNGPLTWGLIITLLAANYLASNELCGAIDVFLVGIIYFKYKISHIKGYEFWAMEALIVLFSFFNNPDINVGIIEIFALVGIFCWTNTGRVTQFFGRISYSLYLLHVPIGGRIVNLGDRFTHSLPVTYLILVIAIGVSILCAWIFYKWVELPSIKFSRQLISKY